MKSERYSINNRPLVSIIIPCHNAQQWVEEAIRSCFQQTYEPLEIIVIDDGSTDESLAILHSFRERITYETGPNRGSAHARNRGLALSRGDYVLFLDADDFIGPETIEGLLQIYDNQAPIIAHCICELIIDTEQGWKRVKDPVFPESLGTDYIRNVLRTWGYPIHSLLYPRGLIEKIGGWDEQLSKRDDADFLLRALFNGAKIMPSQRGVAYQRLHSGHITHATVGSRVSHASINSTIRFASKAEAGLVTRGQLHEYTVELGRLYFETAGDCFSINEHVWGEQLLKKAYQLAGAKVIQGTPTHQLLCRIIGLRNKMRLVEFLAKYGIANSTRRQTLRKLT